MTRKLHYYKREINLSDLVPHFLRLCESKISTIPVVDDINSFISQLNTNWSFKPEGVHPMRQLVWDSDSEDIYYVEKLDKVDLNFKETSTHQWLLLESSIEEYLLWKGFLIDNNFNFMTVDNCSTDIELEFDKDKPCEKLILERLKKNVEPFYGQARIPSAEKDRNIFHEIVNHGSIYKIFFIVDKNADGEDLDEVIVYDLTLVPKNL